MTTQSGCPWTATSNASWITITSGSSGSGPVSYSVLTNTSTSQRTGTMTIAGQAFTVTQSGTVTTSLSISPAIINATINCILNPPPGTGTFTLWSGTVSVTAPDNLSWVVNIPNLPEPGSTVTVTPSSGRGSMNVSVVIKYPSKICWCPCSLSWASGPIAEFRYSDQSTTTTPAAVLRVEVDDSTCSCSSPRDGSINSSFTSTLY